MLIEQATILKNRPLAKDFYLMELAVPQICAQASPGQFVMIGVEPGFEPLLKRPMCINLLNLERGSIRVIYRLIGKGTQLLSTFTPGRKLEIMGPLGHGWQIEPVERALLVGGGAGLAPLLPLAFELRRRGLNFEITVGAHTAAELICLNEFETLAELYVATDDGSAGYQGLVSQFLPEAHAYDMVYCCGPRAMMARVASWAETWRIPCQVSLEERMGCGFGVCMGCVCQSKPPQDRPDAIAYKRVCCEGPVFDSREVVL